MAGWQVQCTGAYDAQMQKARFERASGLMTSTRVARLFVRVTVKYSVLLRSLLLTSPSLHTHPRPHTHPHEKAGRQRDVEARSLPCSFCIPSLVLTLWVPQAASLHGRTRERVVQAAAGNGERDTCLNPVYGHDHATAVLAVTIHRSDGSRPDRGRRA
eukprot:scaffold87765_cov62-Phaeocystis_antarctica.AAC.3